MGHVAKTLFKKSDVRVKLTVMDKSAFFFSSRGRHTISVQILKGSIDFRVHGESHGLQANSVLTLGASIKHELEAREDSAMLLTIAWPSGEKLRAMQHRGYGT